MSQPHPPIPEPQPRPQPHPHGEPHPEHGSGAGQATGSTAASPAEEEPRTQSILLPPSQRPDAPGTAPSVDAPAYGEQPAPGHPVTGPIVAQPGPAATGAFPAQPAHAATPAPAQPAYQPGHDGPYQPSATAPYQPDGSAGWQAAPQPVSGQPLQPAPGAGATQVIGSVAPGSAPGSMHPTGPTTATQQPAADPGGAPGSPAGSPLTAVRKAGRHRTLLLGAGLGVLALVLLELGLALDFGNQALWEVVPTWSAFATVAALVVLVPIVARFAGRGPSAGTAWRIGAAGLAALAVFWVLIALPLVASDRGFWLTAALGAAGAALWLAPGRAG